MGEPDLRRKREGQYEALALLELDRIPEADSLLRGLELAWAPTAPRATAALVQLEAGDPGPARRLLEDLPSEGEPLFYRGLLQAALGNVDAAFSSIEDIEGWEHSPLLGWPSVSLRYLYPRALGPLRADPRYERLVAGIDRSWGLGPEARR